ncbi:hypothetical protein EGR_01594 [Echinococcus granulosus]|uniref:Uncharacterized protein n=1 Tax=Echinococcus granulosus TaxID=6210 RepID=W6UY32_ECHGR|nr:hypothetical protein EGR_01594 [Echinococcus granulosus]EUB63512.1 hypothetical protein EGR_01594 [Echinococcus granulosus]
MVQYLKIHKLYGHAREVTDICVNEEHSMKDYQSEEVASVFPQKLTRCVPYGKLMSKYAVIKQIVYEARALFISSSLDFDIWCLVHVGAWLMLSPPQSRGWIQPPSISLKGIFEEYKYCNIQHLIRKTLKCSKQKMKNGTENLLLILLDSLMKNYILGDGNTLFSPIKLGISLRESNAEKKIGTKRTIIERLENEVVNLKEADQNETSNLGNLKNKISEGSIFDKDEKRGNLKRICNKTEKDQMKMEVETRIEG